MQTITSMFGVFSWWRQQTHASRQSCSYLYPSYKWAAEHLLPRLSYSNSYFWTAHWLLESSPAYWVPLIGPSHTLQTDCRLIDQPENQQALHWRDGIAFIISHLLLGLLAILEMSRWVLCLRTILILQSGLNIWRCIGNWRIGLLILLHWCRIWIARCIVAGFSTCLNIIMVWLTPRIIHPCTASSNKISS